MKIQNINNKILKEYKINKKVFTKIVTYSLTFTLTLSGCTINKAPTLDQAPIESKQDLDGYFYKEAPTESVIEQVIEIPSKDEKIGIPVEDVLEVAFAECPEIIFALQVPSKEEISKKIPKSEKNKKIEEIINKAHILEEQQEIVNDKKLVALTFDDGPGRYTSQLVQILKENNATATFFLVGRSINYYPNAVKEAYLAGNEIAIHTYTHTSFTKMTIEQILGEINKTRELIEGLGVECADLVRPSYGSINNKIVESIDTSFILWNVDTRDWESRDKDKIKEEVRRAIRDGAIILFHDTHKCTIEAIMEILPEYSEEYEFVSVSELFARNKKQLEDNQKYYYLKK